MRTFFADMLTTLAHRLRPKAAPAALLGSQWTGTHFLDAFKRNREPTANELQAELKNTAFACASINAAVCASFAPRLFVATHPEQPAARCLTRALDRPTKQWLRHQPGLPPRITKAAKLEEVLDHPLLTLFQQVNPCMNAFDLWELTTLYQEVHGSAYWYLDIGPLGVPDSIWVLPAQNVTPRRKPDSPNVVDYYEYRTGLHAQEFRPEQIIHFRYPDPRSPYTAGLSPLRACFESVTVLSDYIAFKQAKFENRAIPDAVISPEGPLGEDERDRLEAQWNSKFRRGGTGKVVVAEQALRVELLNQSLGDLAALADAKVTKEDVANAFHVPLAFLTSSTNLANLQAAEQQHMAKAISPRLRRRDQKLNESLIPLYDPSGRLFVASEDPVPLNVDQALNQMTADLKYGVVTINEIRQQRGLGPVPWGNAPWLPLQWAPSDFANREDYAPDTGRNRQPRQ
ncbi:MAG TPA: phage portal protein [Gemmataceae bacterium]|nr:phage portal protein [Gemmataceae bacterium]